MIPKRLEQIDFSALETLVAQSVAESRTLEFKQELLVGKDEDKREFLADVSSFANTAGGDVIYGVRETDGEASGLPGIKVSNRDSEMGRIEDILRSNLEPRLPRVEHRWIDAEDGRIFLILRIARSFLLPHRVTFRDHSKFYGRNNRGKYTMDVGELRSAFVSSELVADRIRAFRNDRLELIKADQAVVPMRGGPKLVCHFIPLPTFGAPANVDFNLIRTRLSPPAGSGSQQRYTLDGLASLSGIEAQPESIFSYSLLFRSGVYEICSSAGALNADGVLIDAASIERDMERSYRSYRDMAKILEIDGPIYILMSFVDVEQSHLYLGDWDRLSAKPRCYRDVLYMPELAMDDLTAQPDVALAPLFEMMFHAFGRVRP